MYLAAIIVGIDGLERYTLPLVESLQQHEIQCAIAIVDNASNEPYPYAGMGHWVQQIRTERLCYSAAINAGKRLIDEKFGLADWYIVLSNDVLCTGPFAHVLEQYSDDTVVGPLMKDVHGFPYLEGWCVCVPAKVWQPWDEAFLGSDYEDADYSTSARKRGCTLIEDTDLPFVHLDQRQRFTVVEDFWGKNAHNREWFMRKHVGG